MLYWDADSGQQGKYDWNQVHASIRTYDDVGLASSLAHR
jgi:hypothetical protein